MALGDSHMTKIAFFVFLSISWLPHHFFRFFSMETGRFLLGIYNAIQLSEEGSNTYVHVTPDFGPLCEPGSKVPLGIDHGGMKVHIIWDIWDITGIPWVNKKPFPC